MKTFVSFFLLTISIAFGQNSLQISNGFIQLDATSQNFEEIKAKNNQVKAEFDPQNGALSCNALIKDFHFKLSLMEEHFNNHYLESDTYPKAYFKGKIIDFDSAKVTTTGTEFVLKGTLTLHGNSKKISTTIIIKNTSSKYILETNFDVLLADFEIKIPKTLTNQISNTSNIKAKFEFKISEK